MYNFIKYKILKKPYCLTKTHDFCSSKKPTCTIILLHGISVNSKCYHNALRFLEGTTSLKNVRFITFDLLGKGKSYKGAELKYNYTEICEALKESIKNARIKTPIILVGHSLSTLISAHFANENKKEIAELILLSAPIFKKEDVAMLVNNPNLSTFIQKNPKETSKDKSFNAYMQNIVTNKANYAMFKNLKTKTTIIYDPEDQLISPKNIKALSKENSKYIDIMEVTGKHKIDRIKYAKILEIVERYLHETI